MNPEDSGAGTYPVDRVCGELPLGDDCHQAKLDALAQSET